ncbi:MAG: hypothetical protein ACPGOZ_01715, partial [Candidatus Puniceispirillum sp.]
MFHVKHFAFMASRQICHSHSQRHPRHNPPPIGSILSLNDEIPRFGSQCKNKSQSEAGSVEKMGRYGQMATKRRIKRLHAGYIIQAILPNLA